MTVRHSTKADLERMLALYAGARERMRKNGNPTQWGTTYPPAETLISDIEAGVSYVIENEGKICGTFAFFLGGDPTYSYIEDGAWLNDEPYGTIHRIAGDGKTRGVLSACIDYCSSVSKNLRIDTHADNSIMHHLLSKYGFTRCGRIYLENGDPRIAYQKLFG